MKKKIVSLVLVGAMALSLAACGGKSNGTTNNANTEAGNSAPEWGEYDALIKAARTSSDLAERVNILHKAEDMLMDTWAVVPLYYYNNSYMLKPDVSGVYMNVMGQIFFQKATKPGATALNLNQASEPDFLDPVLTTSVDGGILACHAFAGLYTYDDNNNIIPSIATDMPEVTDEGKTYTIKLKETLWSNGDALTANDFVYSWNRATAAETAADYAYLFDSIDKKDDGSLAVTAVDDYTLEIKLVAPTPYFNNLMAFPTFFPVHQASVEAANPDGTTPGKWAQEPGFVCNGPYTLQSWAHDQSMTYVANPNYFDAANVTMPELNWMLSADSTATYAAYNAGSLDYIASVPVEEISSLRENNNPEFHIVDYVGTYYTGFNVNDPLFAGKTVEQAAKMRKAMALVIDRSYIVKAIGQQGQIPADSFVPAGMSDGNGDVFKKDASSSYYDAEATGTGMINEAMSLFEEAGYSFTDNGDGSYAISPAISFTYLTNNSAGNVKIGEAIQQDLAQLGIEVKVQQEDWNVFLQNRKDGKFTMCREGWIADYNDPINMLEIFTSDSGNNDMQLGK